MRARDHDVLMQPMDNTTQGSMKTDSEQTQSDAQIYHRAHHRIVFKKFQDSVMEFLDIHKIFDALHDTYVITIAPVIGFTSFRPLVPASR